MRILSIQSSVAYGHVGNSAAVFPLQRLGHDVWPVLTVHFSNHTGYGAWRGPLLDPADVRAVIGGIEDRGVLGQADAVLSGYQGDPAMGAVILEAVARVKELNPDAVYCCDPVIGDVGRGVFVRPGIPEFLRDEVLPKADVLTPQPLRARLPVRPHDAHAGGGPRGGRRGPGARPAQRPGHVGRVRRPAARRRGRAAPGADHRRGLGLRRGRLGGHHAAAADHAQRGRRHHSRAVPRAPARHLLPGGCARAHDRHRVRRAGGDAGGRHPGAADRRCPGSDRPPADRVRGAPAALTAGYRAWAARVRGFSANHWRNVSCCSRSTSRLRAANASIARSTSLPRPSITSW
ncbi:pyridoxal kinase [Nocardioides sp. TF02-7]|uniref:pyridoxal kinase n=1 Tax=Nocardioides sp. TF02-7 TaxID=2917724 RepID=UPI0031F558C5